LVFKPYCGMFQNQSNHQTKQDYNESQMKFKIINPAFSFIDPI
jgi:hypothetical protein